MFKKIKKKRVFINYGLKEYEAISNILDKTNQNRKNNKKRQ